MGLSRLVFMLAILCLAAGCIEIRQQFTINPDQSARVRLSLTLDPDKLDTTSLEGVFDLQHELRQAQTSLRELADRIIANASGVDAWTDYTFEKSGQGKVDLSITGYIPDLSKYRLNPDGGEGLPNMLFTFEPREEQVAITMHLEGINDYVAPSKGPSLSPDEIRDQLRQRRKQFEEEASETKFMFDPLVIAAQLRLPSRIVSTSNFERLSPQEAQIELTGKTFYGMLERVLGDDALAEQAFAHGWDFEDDSIPLPGNQVNEMLFGKNAATAVVIRQSQRPLFDYAKELVRAKGNPPPRLD